MLFKILSSAILTMVITANLSGAELKASKNRILFGSSVLHLNTGCFSVINQKQQILFVYPHFTTKGKDKWYSFSSKQTSPRLVSRENNCWKFQSDIPLNTEEAVLKASETVTITPDNAIETEITWKKPENPVDLAESACFFNLPLQKEENFPIKINDQDIQPVNEIKYGWFSQKMENPTFVLYPGVEGKELTMTFHGKVRVVMDSVKNSRLTVRVIAPQSPIRFTIIPK